MYLTILLIPNKKHPACLLTKTKIDQGNSTTPPQTNNTQLTSAITLFMCPLQHVMWIESPCVVTSYIILISIHQLPPAFRRMREGNVFTGVCQSRVEAEAVGAEGEVGAGEGVSPWSLVPGPFLGRGGEGREGVPQSGPRDGGTLPLHTSPPPGQEYLTPPPRPLRQDMSRTGYGEGGTATQ